MTSFEIKMLAEEKRARRVATNILKLLFFYVSIVLRCRARAGSVRRTTLCVILGPVSRVNVSSIFSVKYIFDNFYVYQ